MMAAVPRVERQRLVESHAPHFRVNVDFREVRIGECSEEHHPASMKRGEGGWKFRLDADRNLTIIRPASTRMTTGPPRVLAA